MDRASPPATSAASAARGTLDQAPTLPAADGLATEVRARGSRLSRTRDADTRAKAFARDGLSAAGRARETAVRFRHVWPNSPGAFREWLLGDAARTALLRVLLARTRQAPQNPGRTCTVCNADSQNSSRRARSQPGSPALFVATDGDGMQWFQCEDHTPAAGAASGSFRVVTLTPIDVWLDSFQWPRCPNGQPCQGSYEAPSRCRWCTGILDFRTR
jgi:hypothetical protein